VRVLIVDDEPPARRRLARLVLEVGEDEIVGEAEDGIEALAAIERLTPDVVLLDISMPGLDGLAVAATDHGVPVIFTTAHAEHAIAAFEIDVVDYLLKPIARERLRAALDRARRHRPNLRLSARYGDTTRVFDASLVARYTARDKYTTCELDGEELVLDESLNALEKRLAKLGFVRVHRAELIRLSRVVRTHGGATGLKLELDDGAIIPVSRRATAEVRRRLRGDPTR
jgi:DNA-binding LytR/AlgR family response regulator